MGEVFLIKDVEVARLSVDSPFIRVPRLVQPVYSPDIPYSPDMPMDVDTCRVYTLAKAHFDPFTHERRVREWRIAWTPEALERIPELREPLLEVVQANESLTDALNQTRKHNQRISKRLLELETGTVWQRVKVAIFGRWMRELA